MFGFALGLGSLVFWMLVAVAVVALVRAFGHRRTAVVSAVSGLGDAGTLRSAWPPTDHGPVTVEQILAERFADGKIDEDEFWQRMTTMRAGRPDGASAATDR